jgi:hypothetical protein
MLVSLQERVQEGTHRRGLEDQQHAEEDEDEQERYRPPQLVLPDQADEVGCQRNAVIDLTARL